jgi:hypothetical protein
VIALLPESVDARGQRSVVRVHSDLIWRVDHPLVLGSVGRPMRHPC